MIKQWHRVARNWQSKDLKPDRLGLESEHRNTFLVLGRYSECQGSLIGFHTQPVVTGLMP